MSKKPGLGASWIEKYWRDVYPKDSISVNGREYRPPKFYDQWLKKNHEDVWTEVMRARNDWLDKQEPTCDNELRARGEIFAAKLRDKPERM